jgi:mono/diheme cytochrome c family protein
MKLSKLSTRFNLILVIIFVSSCSRSADQREYEVMADMSKSYAQKAQEELVDVKGQKTGKSVMRQPVEGTIPRGFEPYMYKTDLEAKDLMNPLPATEEVLSTGKRYYLINCLPCHGTYGAGDGAVITKAQRNQRMPKPPELYSDNLTNNWTDGQLYHLISKGRNNMPAYSDRIDANTRWAIVHYVRALQKARTNEAAKN